MADRYPKHDLDDTDDERLLEDYDEATQTTKMTITPKETASTSQLKTKIKGIPVHMDSRAITVHET